MRAAAYLLLTAAFVLVPSRSYAADILIDISSHFIAESIGDVILDYIDNAATDLGLPGGVQLVEVSASGASETSVHIRVNLQAVFAGFPIPITINADIEMPCDDDGPVVRLGDASIDTLLPVSDEDRQAAIAEAQAMIASESKTLIKPIWQQLGNMPDLATEHGVCPHIDVESNGSVHAEVDFVNGCINGHEEFGADCGRDYRGRGEWYTCENGRWIWHRDCENIHR